MRQRKSVEIMWVKVKVQKKRIEEAFIMKIVKSFHLSSESNWKIYLKWLPVLSKKCWVPISQDGLTQIQCKYLYSVCQKGLFRGVQDSSFWCSSM